MKTSLLILCLSATMLRSQTAVDLVARNDALMAAHPASQVTTVSSYELYLLDQRMAALRAQATVDQARWNANMSAIRKRIQRDIKALEQMSK